MHIEGTVIREGSTVQEAIEKALRSLSINRDQAVIEILDEGRAGFLGIGARRAKVRVTIKDEVIAELKLQDILVDLDIHEIAVKDGQAATKKGRSKFKRNKTTVDGEKLASQVKDIPGGKADSAAEPSAKAGEDVAAALLAEDTDAETGSVESETLAPGTAEIKDGKLLVTNPVNDTYAAVIPGKAVRLAVNGREVTEQALVREDDDVDITIIHDDPVASFELDMSPDKLEAHLMLVRHPGARYGLIDQEAAEKVVVEAELVEIVEPPALTVTDAKKFLQEKNITKGIDEEALQVVLDNPNSKKSFLIAKGEQPIDGVNAYIVYPYIENSNEETEEEGLFGRDKLVSVNAGEVVAIKVPRERGQDGWTVTGEPILAREPVDVELQAKKGCDLIEGGTKIVAAISGRPVVETVSGRILVTIDPVYVVKEVSQLTGDIKFTGDVEVKGDVRDGCTIEANGNIQVFGDVARAILRAGTCVVLHKMVFGSSVVAGGRAAVYSVVRPYLAEVCEILRQMCDTARRRKSSSGAILAADDDGPLVQGLIDSKFPGLPALVKRMADKIVDMEHFVHEDVARLSRQLKRNFTGLGPLRLNNIAILEELKSSAEDTLSLIDFSLKKTDSIKIKYVQNSSLMSSGDVFIEGQGCYISTINAGGMVSIAGKPGIARGVKVVSDGNIFVRDLGSDFETQTHVRIKENGKVSAELIHPDVLVQIGSERFRVDKTSKQFEAFLAAEEKMAINRQVLEESSSSK